MSFLILPKYLQQCDFATYLLPSNGPPKQSPISTPKSDPWNLDSVEIDDDDAIMEKLSKIWGKVSQIKAKVNKLIC